MAIIHQQTLFSWKDCNDLGDLERLQLVIETMPDQKLMQILAKLRGKGRNDNPVQAIWNSILAGIVFQHKSIESLRRELQRNAQLRELCGFAPLKGWLGVPSKSAYNRFLINLLLQKNAIDEMFNYLVKQLKEILPDFGKDLAFDSKAIASLSRTKGNHENDLRGEHDADWGKKTYKGVNDDGTTWEKVKSWFGFKLHLIVDANYELPIAMDLTKASQPDVTAIKEVFEKTAEKHPSLLEGCETGMGDKAYDDGSFISDLWDKHKIKAVIDNRNMWKDKEETRGFEKGKHQYKNITYDYKGTIFCHCPQTGEVRKMAFGGFESKRETLKYICPALHFGIKCAGEKQCSVRQGVRIAIAEDRRMFTPIARSSHKWTKLYKKRTSVERVNSRIETSFGFEKHYIRGLAKMKVRCALSLCVMLAIALGRARQNKLKLMRSLVKVA